MRALSSLFQILIRKAGVPRGGKYYKRVATGKPGRPWQYFYTKGEYEKAHGSGKDREHGHHEGPLAFGDAPDHARLIEFRPTGSAPLAAYGARDPRAARWELEKRHPGITKKIGVAAVIHTNPAAIYVGRRDEVPEAWRSRDFFTPEEQESIKEQGYLTNTKYFNQDHHLARGETSYRAYPNINRLALDYRKHNPRQHALNVAEQTRISKEARAADKAKWKAAQKERAAANKKSGKGVTLDRIMNDPEPQPKYGDVNRGKPLSPKDTGVAESKWTDPEKVRKESLRLRLEAADKPKKEQDRLLTEARKIETAYNDHLKRTKQFPYDKGDAKPGPATIEYRRLESEFMKDAPKSKEEADKLLRDLAYGKYGKSPNPEYDRALDLYRRWKDGMVGYAQHEHFRRLSENGFREDPGASMQAGEKVADAAISTVESGYKGGSYKPAKKTGEAYKAAKAAHKEKAKNRKR
jgi:hypothetical protein